ncbi:uncharacterized protein ASCRUDRAFT_82407 [Ascoidea rubescens DSM 1968]|uniref:Uncharacterized protein n=1 Tax=Ascoidea rubescens DSM 1968 TaxID=1344418 RepID=A0A1D2VBT5_9ASCO|nr:hypothetical protein ASCRUDRAFT_82407 [Ascoidea rubescens DSM 1968]ODV59089.1 hypothetical protein ASCRUDRAFT_82407 [Ascoidea rubescens DSM 1968]
MCDIETQRLPNNFDDFDALENLEILNESNNNLDSYFFEKNESLKNWQQLLLLIMYLKI